MNERAEPVPVMFVVPCFGYGGLEQVVLHLARGLDRTMFRPSFCTLLEPDPDLFREIAECGINCHVLHKGPGINYALPVRLAGLMRRERVRLVNAHDIGATLYAAPAARLAGVRRLVHTDHSQILTKKKLLPVYRWIMKNWVSFSITVSHDLEKYLVANVRLPGARVLTVSNAVDAPRFASGADASRLSRELGIRESDYVVGSVGRLMTQKGHEHLLRAFPKILRAKPDTKLVLVGDGELRGELENLARTLSIESAVIFTGIRRDVPELLELFDLFVLPSLWEGQPLTIMEAMAAGKPIIATDVGDNAVILGAGERGVIVKPGDSSALGLAVIRLASDAALAAALGARAQEYAASAFNVQSMVKRYEEVFSAVMADDTRRLKA